MTVLLSIKPEYAEKIISGEKKYEYRKARFQREGIVKVIVYVTMPIGKVIGEFLIDKIIEDTPQNLWKKTYRYAGIEEAKFNDYFGLRDTAYAIKIKTYTHYPRELYLKEIDPLITSAPQSFQYLTEQNMAQVNRLLKKRVK